MRRLSVLLLAPLILACNDEPTDPPAPETNTVTATVNNQFLPPNAPVRVGGTVTWVFQSVEHSVHFRLKAGAPDNIQEKVSNTTEERTFTTAGEYTYDCGEHPTMTGIITVVPR